MGTPLLPPDHPLVDGRTSGSALILAARRQPVPFTPVWFMRQAGRSLPEYRRMRAAKDMLVTCFEPELVTELTLQPVRRHRVDAAILFCDIVVPLRAIGIDVTIKPGVGPVVADPFRDESDLARLRELDADDVSAILTAVARLVGELGSTPLIGFAGAPFTLASYLIEGGPSRDHALTKSLMISRPELWHGLLDRLAGVSGEFMRLQVLAGASAVQLFDSWAGALPESQYRQYVVEHSRRSLQAVAGLGAPRIHFGVGTGELLGAMSQADCEVLGVDFRVPLDVAVGRSGSPVALQGNLDPAALMASPSALRVAVEDVLERARGLDGHIFNLGHGMLPSIDPGVPGAVVEQVHATTASGGR